MKNTPKQLAGLRNGHRFSQRPPATIKFLAAALLAAASVGLAATSAQAALIANYGLNNNTDVSDLDPALNAQVTTNTLSGFSTQFGPPEGSHAAFIQDDATATVATPTTSHIEFAFSLTPTVGNAITLDATNSVTWALGVFTNSADYTAHSILFIASDAAFNNVLATSSQFTVSRLIAAGGSGANYIFTPTIDAPVTSASALYFGFAFTDANGSSTDAAARNVRFDNVLVNGTVAVIPEPSAALLGGIGLLALIRRRR